jgi:hypothetical protein
MYACNQGDQIGRIFAYWEVVYLDSVLLQTQLKFFGYFSLGKKLCVTFYHKTGCATLWAFFSPAHPACNLKCSNFLKWVFLSCQAD